MTYVLQKFSSSKNNYYSFGSFMTIPVTTIHNLIQKNRIIGHRVELFCHRTAVSPTTTKPVHCGDGGDSNFPPSPRDTAFHRGTPSVLSTVAISRDQEKTEVQKSGNGKSDREI